MNLKIEETTMEVTNINTKTENHGDEVILATDVDVSVNLPVEFLAKFSDTDKDWAKTWKTLLWNKDGEITGHCLSNIEFHHEFKDHTVLIRDEDGETMELEKAKIRKFRAEPLPGYRVNLKFQMRVYPDKVQNGELTALQKQETDIEVMESPQADMFENAQQTEERSALNS